MYMMKKPRFSMSLHAKTAMGLWKNRSVRTQVPMSRIRFVKKGGKNNAVIAKTNSQGTFYLAYYPAPEYYEHFDAARHKLRPLGPADQFPGAVGSLGVNKEKNRWEIMFLQSHFKVNKNGPINRPLATKYGGWRMQVMSELFREAREKKKSVSLHPQNRKKKQNRSRETTVLSIFKKIAQEKGFGVSKENGQYVATPL